MWSSLSVFAGFLVGFPCCFLASISEFPFLLSGFHEYWWFPLIFNGLSYPCPNLSSFPYHPQLGACLDRFEAIQRLSWDPGAN